MMLRNHPEIVILFKALNVGMKPDASALERILKLIKL